MNLRDDIKPITYLKNHTAELVRQVAENGRTVVVTQNGEAKVVVMDVGSYQRLMQSLSMLKLIARGEADFESGATVAQDEAFRRAEAAIARAAGDE